MPIPPFSFHFTVLWLLLLQFSANYITVSSIVIARLRNRHPQNQRIHPNQSSNCALFVGSWVRHEDDSSYPIYDYSSCSVIDPRFNCQKYGRTDTDYLKYRWQPVNCQLPRFDGVEFVTRLRGKSVMFVGDSIGRDQWESLICLVLADLPPSSPKENIGGDPLSTFKLLEYGVTISYYKALYLVDIDINEQGKRVLKLDDIRGNAKAWNGVDVLCFNTGHWWTHTGNIQGWDYMELDGTQYKDMDRLVALERGLRTWAKWIDSNIDTPKTRVFFQGISPSHYYPNEWNSGTMSQPRNCYGETMPMTNSDTSYPEPYLDQVKVTDEVLDSMNRPPFLLDITAMSYMRKDAHPSVYSGELTPEQRSNLDPSVADCDHWCLPGLPDSWNQLFYTALFFSQ
ncbi:protein PMR5-like [Henckelia pumila]|uniref:protein PMR5-like n=1 Tax=Henckelia pumila TaxID=405737 RepID=UPI003C6E1F51